MTPHTIDLKGDFIQKEVVATGIVTPGQQISVAGAAGGGARKAFVLENSLVGKGLDDDYAVGEVVRYGVFGPGCEVYAFLAAGENASKGDALIGDGAGALAVAGSGDEAIAYALEAVNNTSSDPVRVRAEIA